MQPLDYTQELKVALLRKGIVGRCAADLIEEWHDHLNSKIEELETKGLNKSEAHVLAIKALGTPEKLATNALIQRKSSCWSGRHPLLSISIIGALLLTFTFILMYLFGQYLQSSQQELSSTTIRTITFLMNAIPCVFAIIWLVGYRRKMSSGWHGFLIVTLWAVIPFSTTFFQYIPQSAVNQTASFSFGLGIMYLPLIVSKIAITLGTATFLYYLTQRSVYKSTCLNTYENQP